MAPARLHYYPGLALLDLMLTFGSSCWERQGSLRSRMNLSRRSLVLAELASCCVCFYRHADQLNRSARLPAAQIIAVSWSLTGQSSEIQTVPKNPGVGHLVAFEE